jgi:hypothetical protein
MAQAIRHLPGSDENSSTRPSAANFELRPVPGTCSISMTRTLAVNGGIELELASDQLRETIGRV